MYVGLYLFVSFLAAMLQEKSLPYQPGSHTVIRKHRTAQAETVTPSEAKSSHRSAEYCSVPLDRLSDLELNTILENIRRHLWID